MSSAPSETLRGKTQPLLFPSREPAPRAAQPAAAPTRPKRETAARFGAKGSTPPAERSLFVPPSERAAAEADLDASFANLIDEGWESGPIKNPTLPPPLPAAASEAAGPIEVEPPDVPGDEIIVEAEPPPVHAAAARAEIPEGEPEISIEADEPPDEDQIALEVDAPGDDAGVIEVVADSPSEPVSLPSDESQPEIQILRGGRAISSQGLTAVSGAIGDEDDDDEDDENNDKRK